MSGLDCAKAIVYAKLYETIAYSVAELDSATAVAFRVDVLSAPPADGAP